MHGKSSVDINTLVATAEHEHTGALFSAADQSWMQLALALAKRGLGRVSPNPMVGCVIVRNGQKIAQGWHARVGAEHAEVAALRNCSESTEGATLYVNLEPCCHHGRTPPCVQAILQAQIARVVVAQVDPNPQVSGAGIKELRAHGVQVDVGCEAVAARSLNVIFNHNMQHARPFVVAKWAMSLDGKMVANYDDTRNITSSATQQQAHYWRQACDAILIGVNTLINDDPQLNSRYIADDVAPRHPLRLVLDTSARSPLHAKMLAADAPGKTILLSGPQVDMNLQQELQKRGHDLWQCQLNADGSIALPQLLARLQQHNIHSLLVEGGVQVRDAFLSADLVDQLAVYVAPCVIAGLAQKQYWNNVQAVELADDFCLLAQKLGE